MAQGPGQAGGHLTSQPKVRALSGSLAGPLVLVRAARESEADRLSALAERSKAHWGYAPEVLAAWRSQWTLSGEDIRSKIVLVAEIEGEAAGFCSLVPAGSSWELDNLWVLPGFMRRGVGRALVSHALAIASSHGAIEVTVDADPHAEAFYRACGAERRGEVPAPIAGQPHRVRPQLAFGPSKARTS